jgi:hypothetical protein
MPHNFLYGRGWAYLDRKKRVIFWNSVQLFLYTIAFVIYTYLPKFTQCYTSVAIELCVLRTEPQLNYAQGAIRKFLNNVFCQ